MSQTRWVHADPFSELVVDDVARLQWRVTLKYAEKVFRHEAEKRRKYRAILARWGVDEGTRPLQ